MDRLRDRRTYEQKIFCSCCKSRVYPYKFLRRSGRFKNISNKKKTNKNL